MEYKINSKRVLYDLSQKTIIDNYKKFGHKEIINETSEWYSKGFTSLKIPDLILNNIRKQTQKYLKDLILNDLNITIGNLEKEYNFYYKKDVDHFRFIKKIGKLLNPKDLGIDTLFLENKVAEICNINSELTCKNICDIRIFRPYNGLSMDNNPLHRDTWLEPLNNCVNLYIPIAGNNKLSTLTVIPGSHLWEIDDTERTQNNAKLNGVQYGLPSISKINKKFKVKRPFLKKNNVLLFSSNLIHGGALNLNKDLTRISIEIRFWVNN